MNGASFLGLQRIADPKANRRWSTKSQMIGRSQPAGIRRKLLKRVGLGFAFTETFAQL
jgi:hypothetical protein